MFVDGLRRPASEFGDFLGLETPAHQRQTLLFRGRKALVPGGLAGHGSVCLAGVQGPGHGKQGLPVRGVANALVGVKQVQGSRDLQQGLGVRPLGAGRLSQQDSAARSQLLRNLHQPGHRNPVLAAFVFLDLLNADPDQARKVLLRQPGGLAVGAHAGADFDVNGIGSLCHCHGLQAQGRLGERGIGRRSLRHGRSTIRMDAPDQVQKNHQGQRNGRRTAMAVALSEPGGGRCSVERLGRQIFTVAGHISGQAPPGQGSRQFLSAFGSVIGVDPVPV